MSIYDDIVWQEHTGPYRYERFHSFWPWYAGVDGLDRSIPRPHWKRPGLGLNGDEKYAKPASGI